MIKDPISKLYQHMSSQELALLAFANMTTNNPLEQARIADAVPRHTYRCFDAAFTQHLDNVFNMALCWSIQYWQCKAREMAANSCLLGHLNANDSIDIKQLTLDDEIVERYSQQVAAVEIALEEICREYGIDINIVKQIAGITTATTDKTTPDADYLKKIKGEMCAVLEIKGQ